MTWSAFALFLVHRTEFAFNIGHLLIILLFHSHFWSFYFFNIWSILKSLFWMKLKQIQGSVRVKINEYVHAWSEFLFVSLLVIFNFFPQINHFYYFTSLHGLQDVENHRTALNWEISSRRLVEKFHISPCIILYIIGLESMKLQN